MHSPGGHTIIRQASVRRSYRHSSSWIYLEATLGRQFSFVICCFVVGGAERQEGGGLACAWTTGGPKVLWHQRPDEAPGGAEGTVTTEQQFCFILLLLLTCHISTRKSSKFIEIGSL